MSLHNLIANGGTVLVVGSENKSWEAFRGHPQVVFWTGSQAEISREVRANSGRLPDNTRALILSKYLSHREAEPLRLDARRKKVVIFQHKKDGEVTRLLEEMIAKEPEPSKSKPVEVESKPKEGDLRKPIRGELVSFVKTHLNPDLGPAEEARRLLPLVREAGFSSSFRSIEQSVSYLRKQLGLRAAVTEPVVVREPSKIEREPSKIEPEPKPEPVATLPSPRLKEGLDLIEDTLKYLDGFVTNLQLLKVILQEVHESGAAYDQLRAQLLALVGKR